MSQERLNDNFAPNVMKEWSIPKKSQPAFSQHK
jgi:hypothetical protein